MKPRLTAVVFSIIIILAAFCVFWLRESGKSGEEISGKKAPVEVRSAQAGNPGNFAQTTPATAVSASNLSTVPKAIAANSFPANPAAAPVAPDTNGQISPGALKQIAALEEAKAARTPAQQKMDSQLLYADKMRRNVPVAEGVPTQRVDLDTDGQGRVLVDITANVTDGLLRQIEALGGRVINSFPQYHAIRAAMPLAGMEDLASDRAVKFVGPAIRALHNNVDSQGDFTHQASTARANFGVNGSGVKVGVLSDSEDHLAASQIAGLVTVLPGQSGEPGTGEGTAMLEIVNDLAPGAQLYFATAGGGEASFANNIQQLRANGCDIIVDDEGYFDESPFQDGVIAQAVNQVTTNGGLYFSSAGNSGNLDSGTSGTWEGDFVNGGAAGAPVNGKGGFVHNFGSANYDTVSTPSSGGYATVLFWSDPLGAATNDYDLFVLNSTGTTIISSSTTVQNGSQDPYENVPAPSAGQRLVVVLASGTGRFLHLDTQRGVLSIGTSGSTRGHNAATNAFTVAATDVHNSYPNPFTGGGANPVETFSSDGPRRMFYFPNGTPFTPGNFSSAGGTVFQKPDLTAADGVTTDVTGFSSFYGTSAAAPHAAAIAALLKSYNPLLSPAQLRQVLTNTALDIMAAGTDRDAGAGIVMAMAALQSTFPDALQIRPRPGFSASGPAGGPFSVTSQAYLLTNAGATSLSWSLVNTSAWLNASVTSGTLAAGATNSVTINLTATANSLAIGAYAATVNFSNSNTHFVQGLPFNLLAQQPLVVTPSTGFTASGPVAGPFSPSSGNFQLTNTGSSSLTWSLISTSAWLTASGGGTLAAGAITTATVSLGFTATNLPGGTYTANVWFTNQTKGGAQSRLITLLVNPPLIQNGGFETGDFTSWTLNGHTGNENFVDNGANVTAITPHSGSFFAALGEVGQLAYLSQNITTSAGQSYLLSLWLDSPNVNPTIPNAFLVQWNGNTLFSSTNMGAFTWSNLQYIVTATTSSSALNIGAQDDNYYLGLDDVSLTPIPAAAFQPATTVKTNNNLKFTWNALTGLVYQVQFKTNLLQANWAVLKSITATNTPTTFVDTNPITGTPQKFYRLLLLP